MTRHIRTLLLVASLVACTATRPTNVEIAALPHSSADTKTYAVHLHHEPVEGARSHMIVDAHERRTITVSGQPTANETKKSVHFDAVATILTVEAGQEKSTRYDVTSLVVDGTSIFRGQVDLARARKDLDAVLTTNGQPFDSDARDALDEVLTFHVGYDDDALFGTSQLQRIGARWLINSSRSEQELSAAGIASASVSGAATLDGVRRVGTLDCLDVHVTLHITNVDLNRDDVIVEDSAIDGEQWGLYPVDGSRDPVEDHSIINVKYAMRASAGETTVVEATRRRDGRYEPL
jgi:hypothetical protein